LGADHGFWLTDGRFGLALLIRGLSVLPQYRVTLESTLYLQQRVLHLHFPSAGNKARLLRGLLRQIDTALGAICGLNRVGKITANSLDCGKICQY
jgi:hypothetical protein